MTGNMRKRSYTVSFSEGGLQLLGMVKKKGPDLGKGKWRNIQRRKEFLSFKPP